MEVKNNTNKSSKKRTWTGTVVSDKMDKTIVVRVDRAVHHPVYKKRIITSKKYKVHDEENKYSVGDKVQFVASRPISKHKKWTVIS